MSFEIPHALKEAIKDERVVIFIGAGLSKHSGLPLWKDIVIRTLCDPAIEKGDKFKAALEDDLFSPLEILDKIQDKHRRRVYKNFEEQSSTLVTNEIYKTISKISRKIITTNYDKLIEHNTNIKTIDTSSTFNLQKLDTIDEFILKIHGDCNAIDNAVIFTSDYENLYNTSNGLAKFQLEKLVSSHTCLFVGFSLSDNYVVNLFDKLSAIYKGLGREHFIISTGNIDHDFVDTIAINSHDALPELLSTLTKFKPVVSASTPPLSETHLSQEQSTALQDKQNLLPEDGIKIHTGHDTPPIIENWTGRSAELKSLLAPHKVCFITGIGGQGKSALASKLLTEIDRGEYQFCDWRDFKEEDLNLQSKLFQLIELVSNSEIHTSQLVGLETENLIDIFFDKLGSQRGIFVFDNIDKYVDLQKFTPAGDMFTFFDRALKLHHNSKFVFTCRPFIHFAGIDFYQVRLVGLVFNDAKELIRKYHYKLQEEELHQITVKLHEATQGHPLWMGLVLAQSRTDAKQLYDVLQKIAKPHSSQADTDISSIISERILENVWDSLKDREKIILRTLSISNISETEEDLAKIVSKKIKYNQFSRALKSLKSLNLIILKEGAGHIELHPLVREFIKTNYGKEEQESYIALYVNYLDGFIVLIKNKLGMVLGSEDLDVIIKKIEILINTDKIQDSINELRTTSDSFQISGYCEEFLRLCDLLLSKNIWTNKKITSLHSFFDFINNFFTRAAEFGCYEMFEKYMEMYTNLFKTPDIYMILSKSAICHKEWLTGNYDKAIREGKSASDLIDMLEESDTWHGKHRYNLALRDSKINANVELALTYFCSGSPIREYLNNECNISASAEYGNIGRCLLYLNQPDEALFLTIKSYRALNSDGLNYFNNHNLGYAAKWIGEMLSKTTPQDHLYFYLHARNLWKNDMPSESNKIDTLIKKSPATMSNQSITSLESWQIKKFCDDWVNSYFQNNSSKYL